MKRFAASKIGASFHRNQWIYLQLAASLIFAFTDGITGLDLISSPKIYPDTQDYIAEPGGNISITCEGNAQLEWKISQDLEKKVNVTDLDNLHAGYTYGKVLHIYNITYIDVGYVTCFYVDFYDEKFQTMTDLVSLGQAQQKYIFVNDSFSSLKIYPDTPDYIAEPGENISITCEGNAKLDWEIGQDLEQKVNFTDLENLHAGYTYGKVLHIYNITYMDVGYVTCFYVDLYDENFQTMTDLVALGQAQQLYIFVNDPNMLSVPVDSMLISEMYQPVVIPCRPTAPDVEVELQVDSKSEFNNKIGFILLSLDEKIVGYKKCIFKKNNVTKDQDINVQASHPVPKPTIVDSYNGKVTAGSNLTLDCTVAREKWDYFNLEWTAPNMDYLKSQNRVHIEESTLEHDRIASSQIVVLNVTLNEQGTYECLCSDIQNFNVKHKDAVNITVFDIGSSYIKLDLESDYKADVTEMVGRFVEWSVFIDAYPEVNISWYDSENREVLEKSSHFDVEKRKTETYMKIDSVKLSDSGQYTLKIWNEYETQVLNFSLTVEAPPTVEKIPEKYYVAGIPALVECHVIGFPIPHIKWYFQPCMLDNECKEEQILTSNTTVMSKSWEVTSTVSMSATKSGLLKCHAENKYDEQNVTTLFIVSDVFNGFGIEEFSKPIALEDNVTLVCDASIYNYTENVKWFGPEMKEINEDTGDITITRSKTQYSYRSSLNIASAGKQHSGDYTCRATNIQQQNLEDAQTVYVDVEDWVSPYISYSNLNNSKQFVALGERDVVLDCEIQGVPSPNVQWYKDSLPWLPSDSDRFLVLNEKPQSRIVFKYIKDEDDGEYTCEAVTKAGSVARHTQIVIENKYGNKIIFFIIIAVIFCVLLILISYLIWRIRKEKAKRRELSKIGLLHFEEGNILSLNPEIGIDEQADLLPYDKKWEFPRDKLELGKELGSGAFGVVLRGEARGILDAELSTTVAVKMVKRAADPKHIKALASELKIMMYLGKHLNVVNLLGACTNNIAKRELLVIVEYCPYGNIQKYIARHRSVFIDQFNNAGTFNAQQYSRTCSRSSNNESHQMNDYNTDQAISMTTGQTALCTDDTNRFVHDSQGSEENQPHWRSNYQCDYEYNGQQRRPLCSRDLVCWAFQIARGMEYLADRGVLHGDLAARNIVLADDNVVKICDFGLARNLSKNDNYRKEGDCELPIRWMAIESLLDKIFSTQSDVWSFGVVLWEMFSLASTPYPGLDNKKVYYKMMEGYRMGKPKYANDSLYSMMRECWDAEPVQRPSFTQLQERLGAVLEDSVRTHYMQLNEPYLEMNRSWLAQMDTDYLQMMAAPHYTNLMASASREYVNAPHELSLSPHSPLPSPIDAEGYLYMCPNRQGLIYVTKPEDNQIVFDSRSAGKQYNFDVESNNHNELIPMLAKPKDQRTTSESGYEGSTSLEDSFTNSVYSQVVPRSGINNSDDVFDNGDIAESDKMAANRVKDWQSAAFSNPTYVSVGIQNSNCNNNDFPNQYMNMKPLGGQLKV